MINEKKGMILKMISKSTILIIIVLRSIWAIPSIKTHIILSSRVKILMIKIFNIIMFGRSVWVLTIGDQELLDMPFLIPIHRDF